MEDFLMRLFNEDEWRKKKVEQLRNMWGYDKQNPVKSQGDASLNSIFTDSLPVKPDVLMEKYNPFLYYHMMNEIPNVWTQELEKNYPSPFYKHRQQWL